jgi:hypothetical protein
MFVTARVLRSHAMNEGEDQSREEAEADLEREIRQRRKFTAADAVARMAGPGAMKGASPVSPAQQARTEIGTWLRANVADPSGALHEVLHRHVAGSAALMDDPGRPLQALAACCRRLLASDLLLRELVREADVEWGRRMDERPYFEREGAPRHPEDPYTAASVREVLRDLVARAEQTADH